MPHADPPGGPQVPPLAAVRAFEAAARHQSFTRAAAELGMTQAAVSYQIKMLEDRLGGPLFVRRARQVTLTPMGQRLSGPVTKALRALEAAFAEAAGRTENVLSITTTLSLATWLAPRLGSFQIAHPEFAVRLDSSNRLIDFSDGEFDIGLRTGRGEWPGLAAHRMFPIQYTPVCSPDVLARHDFRKPADLLHARLISGDDPWWGRWFSEAGAGDFGGAGQATLALGTQAMEVQAALAGHGVAIIMPRFFPEELRSGRLVQIFDVVAEDPSSFWLVYPVERRRARKIRLFRDWLLAEAEASSRELAERAPAFALRRAAND
jgi:LysR family glycine cleavage system transcriptional activator